MVSHEEGNHKERATNNRKKLRVRWEKYWRGYSISENSGVDYSNSISREGDN